MDVTLLSSALAHQELAGWLDAHEGAITSHNSFTQRGPIYSPCGSILFTDLAELRSNLTYM